MNGLRQSLKLNSSLFSQGPEWSLGRYLIHEIYTVLDLWGTLISRSCPRGVYHLDKNAGFGNNAGKQGTRLITQGFLLSMRDGIYFLCWPCPLKNIRLKHLEDTEFPGNSYTAQSGQLFPLSPPQVWLTWPHPWLLHLPFALSPFWLWAQTCHGASLLPRLHFGISCYLYENLLLQPVISNQLNETHPWSSYSCCSLPPKSEGHGFRWTLWPNAPSRTHIFSKTESGAEDLNIWVANHWQIGEVYDPP